jgi:hypothetical protein
MLCSIAFETFLITEFESSMPALRRCRYTIVKRQYPQLHTTYENPFVHVL